MSQFIKGDHVETICVVNDLTWSGPLQPGLRGVLNRLYRIQEGREIWCLWLDSECIESMYAGTEGLFRKRMVCVNDLQIQKI